MVAEQNIIGEMITNPEIIAEVSAVLEPQMFTSAFLGRAFFEICKAEKDGSLPDISYLAHHLTDFPQEIITQELAEAVSNAPMSVYYKTDMQTVLDEYNARRVNDILNHTEITPGNVYDQMEQIRASLDGIQGAGGSSKSVSEIAKAHREEYFRKRNKSLMKTGFKGLDDLLGTLENGDMVVIGARPAVGKTAFGLQMASQITDNGFKVMLFNLEMTESQIYERQVSYEGGISLHRLRIAEFFQTEEERVRFENANKALDAKNNLIVSTGSKSVAQIRREVRGVKPDLVIIDYLQLLKSDVSYRGNRYAEVGAISHAIKSLAIEMEIPVIVLTQLNRNVDESKEPSMSEIRESGDVEQDAGVIILLWNKNADDKSQKGCKVDKNRYGETGKIDLTFNGSEMRFEDSNGFKKVDDYDELPFSPST